VNQQRLADQDDEFRLTAKAQLVSELRSTHLGKLKDNKEYLTSWEQQGQQNHAKNQTDKLERERRDLRLELAMREKARRKAASENLVAVDEAFSGIDSFEESLRRLQVQLLLACCCLPAAAGMLLLACCCWIAAAGMLLLA
jgi:hypothetical protein